MEDSRHVQSYSIHPSNNREVPEHVPQVTDDNNEHESTKKYPKPMAFDVPLNNSISSIERKLYPKRLEVSFTLVFVSPFVGTLLFLCYTIYIVIFTLETRE